MKTYLLLLLSIMKKKKKGFHVKFLNSNIQYNNQ